MKPRLAFIVPGIVVASQRVRKIPFIKANQRLGVRGVTPPESRSYMEKVALFARQAAAKVPEWKHVVAQKLPVRVQLHVVRQQWRGDIDNLSKNLFDGLGASGDVFFNDNRVVQMTASIHTHPAAVPRAELVVDTANAYLDKPLWMEIALSEGWTPPRQQGLG